MSDVERLLVEAFDDARATVQPTADLWARVSRSLDEARARRRFRLAVAGGVLGFAAGAGALAVALSSLDDGRSTMPWWVIEVITDLVLVALAVALGPFIKRFGRAYAADVFRANPRTGKSYLVLTDVAYYLIFGSYVLFTVTFVPPYDWERDVAEQLQDEAARIGGMLLLLGILHAANVVMLPVIGRLLATRRGSDAQPGGVPPGSSTVATPPLGPGTWVLRIEPAGGEPDPGP